MGFFKVIIAMGWAGSVTALGGGAVAIMPLLVNAGGPWLVLGMLACAWLSISTATLVLSVLWVRVLRAPCVRACSLVASAWRDGRRSSRALLQQGGDGGGTSDSDA
eukprot:5019096-Prymnesium_polylepis.1